jgi:hypothetical protein
MNSGDWHYPMAGNGHYPRNSLYCACGARLLDNKRARGRRKWLESTRVCYVRLEDGRWVNKEELVAISLDSPR